MTTLDVVIVFGMAWLAVVSGVVLGGHLVFRSSKPGAGPLFHVKQDSPTGVAQIEDELDVEAEGVVLDQNARFKAIFSKNLEESV